jgi:hypothetical protein
MPSHLDDAATAQEWRLKAKLDTHQSPADALEGMVGRLRPYHFLRDAILADAPDSHLVKEVKAAVGDDVVITHDGELLFAYAPSQPAIDGARKAIESVLGEDQIEAQIIVSIWDHERDRWRQVEPPPSAQQGQVQAAAARADEAVETRTLVANAGRLVRADFEAAMSSGAQALGLECSIVEHPHLLTSQIAFTVTGPKRKIDEFASDLRAEGAATVRADGLVVASPL